MNKPKNYEETQEYSGSGEKLEPGNYVCEIRMMEEAMSKSQRPMLKIYLEIVEGQYKGYFQRRYENDTRDTKKWPCIVYQVTEDANGDCSRGLKSFIGAVKASNPGFDDESIWGPNFCKWFRGKKVGASFRREEYVGNDGEPRWSVKPTFFCNADKVDEMDIPRDKPLPVPEYNPPQWGDMPSGSGNPWD